MSSVCEALADARNNLRTPERQEEKHRRGRFTVFASGISYGGGQTVRLSYKCSSAPFLTGATSIRQS